MNEKQRKTPSLNVCISVGYVTLSLSDVQIRPGSCSPWLRPSAQHYQAAASHFAHVALDMGFLGRSDHTCSSSAGHHCLGWRKSFNQPQSTAIYRNQPLFSFQQLPMDGHPWAKPKVKLTSNTEHLGPSIVGIPRATVLHGTPAKSARTAWRVEIQLKM